MPFESPIRRKKRVHLLVVMPMQGLEHGARDLQMTQRPQGSIDKAIVKAAHLGFTEPHTPQGVLGILRGYLYAVVRIDDLAIGTATLPGHPGAMAGLHDRLERCGEASGWLTAAHGVVAL
jgi:hypothetical protein